MKEGDRPGEILSFARDIRLEHTLFALPFGLLGAFRGAGGVPPLRPLVLVLAAMFFARTAAMGFNRLADAGLDAENPRTRDRAIPRGDLSPRTARILVALSACAFIATAGAINRFALAASPFVLAILLGYSYAKRFTTLAHLWLGVALGLAPLGGEVALAGRLTPPTLALGAAVVFWVAGFDILYATMDIAFDRAKGLRAIPAVLGVPRALALSALLQAASLVALGSAAAATPTLRAALGLLFVAGLLAAEQYLVDPNDLTRVPHAFFTINAWVGWVVFGAYV